MALPTKYDNYVKKIDKKEMEQISKLAFASPRSKRKKILCIILNENSTTTWLWKKYTTKSFSFNKCWYYVIHDGSYKTSTGTIILIYLEGISTPMSHDNIDKQQKKVEIINPETNKKEEHTIHLIKGLKFDGKLIDMLLNRDLFAEFTRQRIDLPTTITAILLMVVVILSIVNIIVSFVA